MKSLNAEPPSRRAEQRETTKNSLSAGARILGAIEEATEILRTEGLRSKQLNIRTYKVPAAPPSYQSGDVKRVRELLGASQAVLAAFLGVNVNTVRSWEQGNVSRSRSHPASSRRSKLTLTTGDDGSRKTPLNENERSGLKVDKNPARTIHAALRA